MVVNGTGPMTISVAQKDKKRQTDDPDYEYGNCRLILIKIGASDGNSEVIYVAGTKGFYQKDLSSNRDRHLELQCLKDGQYLVFAELEWPQSYSYPLVDFVITAYGAADVQFESEGYEDFTRE